MTARKETTPWVTHEQALEIMEMRSRKFTYRAIGLKMGMNEKRIEGVVRRNNDMMERSFNFPFYIRTARFGAGVKR